jgi:hypothetical protein
MVRRTRSRRTRPKRATGQGIGAPSRASKTDPWKEVGKRVDVSYDVLGHPQQTRRPANEGKHYTVLAYTDWADQFIPTTVKWNHGEVDDLTDPVKSRLNREKAIKYAWGEPEKEAKPHVKYMFDRYGTPYYGIYDPMKDKYLHEDGSWTDPYPEKGAMYYTDNEDNAGLKLSSIKSEPEHQNKTVTRPYVVELYSNKDDGVYEVEVQAGSLADAEHKGLEILSKKYPRHGSDVVAYEKVNEMGQTIKPAKAQRRFDGKWYTEHTGAYTVKEANEKAEDIRKRGYYARVIPSGSGYTVYARKKGGI